MFRILRQSRTTTKKLHRAAELCTQTIPEATVIKSRSYSHQEQKLQSSRAEATGLGQKLQSQGQTAAEVVIEFIYDLIDLRNPDRPLLFLYTEYCSSVGP